MVKPWGMVESLATYTRSMVVKSIERKKKGVRVYYPNRNPKDDPLSIFIAYRNLLHLSQHGLGYVVTFKVEEWTGQESLHCAPSFDEATTLWRCTSFSSQRKFFIASANARFLTRDGSAWPGAE